MLELLSNPEIWVAFLTLTALEIVLGIDNIIMIAILVGRMPPHLQSRTRFFDSRKTFWARSACSGSRTPASSVSSMSSTSSSTEWTIVSLAPAL